MGYILPVTHYQYNDYRQRVEQTKRDPFLVERAFKLDLEQHLNNPEPREEDRKEYQFYSEHIKSQRLNQELYTPTTIHAAKVHKIYSDLTGLGRHFNESV